MDGKTRFIIADTIVTQRYCPKQWPKSTAMINICRKLSENERHDVIVTISFWQHTQSVLNESK